MRKLSLYAFALLGLVALGVWLVGGPLRPSVDLEPDPARPQAEPSAQSSALEGAESAPPSLREDASASEGSSPSAGEATPAGSAAAEAQALPLAVRGVLLEGASSAPIAQATLQLVHAQTGQSQRCTSDAAGRFELDLDPEAFAYGATCSLHVASAEGALLFRGPIVLEAELLVLARTRLNLRGTLVAPLPFDQRPHFVSASTPASDSQESQHAGRARLDADGRFELEAWVDARPDHFWMRFGDERGLFHFAQASSEELTSAAGARFEVQVGELSLSCLDGEGAPLEGVEVRVWSSALGSHAHFSSARSDEGGALSFALPPGPWELCAGRAGHDFVLESGELGPGASEHLSLLLRSLEDDGGFGGLVLDTRGAPVSNAHVTAGPRTDNPELAVAAMGATSTDAQGRFRMPMAGNGVLLVTAYERSHGLSPAVELQPGERELVLRFAALGGLRV